MDRVSRISWAPYNSLLRRATDTDATGPSFGPHDAS